MWLLAGAVGVVLGAGLVVVWRKRTAIEAYAEGHRDGEAAGRMAERAAVGKS